jgi:hypothetical protein
MPIAEPRTAAVNVLVTVGLFYRLSCHSLTGRAADLGLFPSRERAERAALRAVGAGRVTWSDREDERAAAREIEVTRPDASPAGARGPPVLRTVLSTTCLSRSRRRR